MVNSFNELKQKMSPQRREQIENRAEAIWMGMADELELAKEIFPFEAGQTYDLPTLYDSFGAAEMLAEALATYQTKDCQSA
jgi:hypothetical protein